MKKILPIALLINLLFPRFSFAQVVYSHGTVNQYLKVLQVSGDRVKVENDADIDLFLPGDKVVLIQMTGGLKAIIVEDWREDLYAGPQQCGKFEILQVAEVQKVPEYLVIFTDNVFDTYDDGEKIQLVRMLEGDKIIVDGKITAREWDGNTGGIIAIIGADTIDLGADIDASESGFRGGSPEDFSPVNCRTDDPDTVNWTESETGRAGHKGEGIISVADTFTRGTSDALNGGGSGYGKYSGGGGGSNYRGGGIGGIQYYLCPKIDIWASGGFNQLNYYRLFCNPSTRRIIMGGGGGAGTQDISDSRVATPGGDGGGIILLVTETLLGNGGALKSNGQNVTDVASASGGGGGAGGTILVDAAAYSGTFSVEAKGGNGGNTGSNCTGAGGSGSGGILWHSGLQLFPGATVSVNYLAGTQGRTVTSDCGGNTFQWGANGGTGGQEDSLLLILNGFLFNTIRGKDTICAGQQPNLITGSSPKGGNGVYTFDWKQSPDGTTWTPADGMRTEKNYQPPVLSQTTLYQRTVTSQGIEDISLPVKIYVYPAITGNVITGTDTICYNSDAGQLTGTIPPALAGGNGSFAYSWLYSNNGTTWNTISNETSADYDPGQLTASRYYRRFVQSTPYCSHTSSSDTITVLPSITSNSFYSPDTTICQSFGPGKLNAKKPGNGDGSYRFAWWQKSVSSGWSVIPGATDTLYDPGLLDETMRYKRIVFSGMDDACKDTSLEKLVTVLDSITNNTIAIDPSRYCAGDNPSPIDGATPGGGDIGNYTYEWQIKTIGNWTVINGAANEDYTPQMVETNTQFRRFISSGQLKVAGKYACHSTSPALSLEVIPYIINHLGLEDQTLCQHNTPLSFDPDTATGGYGNITYQWIGQEEGSALWTDAPGTSTLSNYVPGPLEKTTYFARKAMSDICEQISDTITVTVYPVISNNIITGSPAVYTCFNTAKTLNGPGYSGGKSGDYAFLWQQSNDNSVWNPASGTNNLAGFVTSALADSLLLRRIIYSSASGKECSDTSVPVTVRINSLPSGDIVSSVDTLCAGESLDIRFNVSGGHGPWDVTVGEDEFTGSMNNVTENSGFITMDFDQDHIIRMLEIRDDSLCLADASAFSNEVIVKVYEFPEADAGEGGEVCGLQFALHAGDIDPSHKGVWTAPGGSFPGSDNTDPAAVITLDHYGKEYITWTVTNWHCSDWDTAGVTFYEQPLQEDISAGEDHSLDFIYLDSLEAWPPSVGTGHWKAVEGTGIFSNDTLFNTIVSELSDKNLLRWTIINGVCPEIKDSVEIIVNPLKVPKGFTPNGDGDNEEFIIHNIENAVKITVAIYARTGALVFESPDYTNDEKWKGTGKNDLALPEGTYYYDMYIWVKGKTEPVHYKSFVEILR